MAIKFFNNIEVDSTVDGVDISTFKSAYDNHNHDGRYYTEAEADGRFVNVSGDTMTGNLDVNADIQGNTFTQAASGIPRNNLGAPTVTEMALFDSQFTPKTTLANDYNDLSDLTFWVQSTSSSSWTEVTTYSDDQKRKFLRTANSGVVIPNGAYKFRVEFVGKGYTFANALYGYWSSNSHNTRVHIWKYNQSTSAWTQHTSSSATVSSWPGHLYLPFSTIPWHETHTTSTGHFKSIRIEFTPTWSTGSYSDRNINLYGLEIWGGYPSGRREPHYYDQNGKLKTWGDFEVNGNAVIDGNVGIGKTNPGQKLDVAGNIAVSGTVDGRDIATDGAKLDGIESGATADQTASEILTAIKTVDGIESGLDADLLDGLHESTFMRKSANSQLDMNQNDIVDGNTIYMDNWYRSYNSTGWYNQTYGGGIYMTDSTWVRLYNNKKFRVDNAIRCKSSSSGQYALETQYANDVSGGGFYHNSASGMELRLNNTSGIQTIALRGNAGTTHSFINAGNFGIGTTAPSYKTDVINTASNQTTMDSLTFRARSENYAGTVAVFENNSGINTSIRISDTVDDMYVVSRNGIMGLGPSGGWSSSNLNIKSNGFVGIGHRNPSDRLHVKNGSIRAEGSVKFYEGATNRGFVGPNGSLLTISSTYKTVFKTGATQTERMRLTDVGNLGVGTDDPDHRVDVNGSVRASNFYTSSDYRLKSNVTPLDNAITRVKQLDAYRFNWNDRLDEPKVDGFIAHEVASVVPEAVSLSKDAVDENGNPKYQSVDQTKIIPLLTAALQEAIQKIESLETRIQTLENN